MTKDQIKFLPGEPHIMPHQDIAFNGDEFICEEFINLRDRFQINTAIETGSATGGTTNWLAGQFEKVHSIEINAGYLKIAKERCKVHTNITFYLGDSPTILAYQLNKIGNRTIYFLDAHWHEQCPLKSELAAIANAGLRPVIAIHDFFVPDESGLGCDSYNGQPFTFEWLKPSFDAIYNERRIDDKKVPDDYEYYYNSFEKSGGAHRGIIYILPK